MDSQRIGRFTLAGALLVALGAPSHAQPPSITISLPHNVQSAFAYPDSAGGFPFPIPNGAGGIMLPISLPGQNGGGYQTGYNTPGTLTIPIPLPGGGTLPIPISLPGNGYPNTGYFPQPQHGGYYPQPQAGYYYPPQNSGYHPQNGGYYPPARMGYTPRNGEWAENGHDGHDQGPTADGRVGGYDTITYQGQPCAVNRENLPLLVYSQSPGQAHLLHQAASVWNEAGQRMGGTKFIEVVSGPTSGAIAIDWSGRGMPAGAAGLTTMMKSRSGVRVTGIGIRPMRNASQQKLVEVLSHEIGHALGLDHSDDRGDLMYRSTRPQSQRSQMLSARDLQMLQWLYSQRNAVPIVAAR